MKILALDISSHTGWAFGDSADAKPIYGVVHLNTSPGLIGQPLYEFDEWLKASLKKFIPDLVVFECPIMRDPTKTRIDILRLLYSLAGLVEMRCYRWEFRCAEEHLQSIKKFMTGNGRADKPEVVAAVNRQFGFDLKKADNNEADAIALWALACHKQDETNARRFDLGPLGAAAK